MSVTKEERRNQRLELVRRLEEEDAEDLIGPMRECGQMVPFVCTNCGHDHDVPMHCKRRYCPECQPMLTMQKTQRWSHAISSIQWPLFVTLTMSNSSDPAIVANIKKAWQKFRRRKLIKDKVKGGVATYEITNKGNGWHPHIHAVMDCRWLSLHVPEPLRRDPKEVVEKKCALAKKELSALWAEQLKQEVAIVDVQRVYDQDKVISEVIKYAMKGSDLVNSPDDIAPMLRAIKGTRMLAGWGSLFPLPSMDEEESPGVACKECDATKTLLPADVMQYITRCSNPTPDHQLYARQRKHMG